jgi:hypothetical protein
LQHASTLIDEMDDLHRRLSSDQLELFRLIADADRHAAWKNAGARDMAAWLSIRYGMSEWKARRWIAAAYALEALPSLSDALASGRLGVDKVVELARFAAFDTEDGLITWATRVSVAAVRRRADLEVGGPIEDVRDAQRQRFLTWWFSEDRTRLGLEGELPAAEGSVVARAIERLAEKIPVMPGEENRVFSTARNADALVALCSARIAEDQDADRATVVVHVRAGDGSAGSDIDGGPVIHPDTARRLLCEARTQVVVEDDAARPLALGRMTREPSAWMLRQLRYRDGGCTFPGCGSQRFAKAHHVRVVAPRRDDRPRQPHHGLQLPPQARPRARMEGRARRGRDDALVPAGRNAILGRSVGAGYCRTAPRGGSFSAALTRPPT